MEIPAINNLPEILYRSIFEGMADGCAYCQLTYEDSLPTDWIYLAVNPAFETLTGLKNVVGRKVSEVMPGIWDTSHELFEIYGRVAETGVSEEFETLVNSTNLWFRVHVSSPGSRQIIAVFRNVTEEKQAKEVARLSEERFRMLFDLSPDPISLSRRADGALLSVNKAWSEITGIPVNEAIGQNPEALGAWSKPLERQTLHDELGQARNSTLREFSLRRRNGDERRMLVTSNLLVTGNEEQVLTLGKDITEYHALSASLQARTQELERSESKFRLVFERAPLGMALVDSTSGRFLSVNPGLGEIVGYTPEELLHLTFQQITHPEHLADDLASVKALAAGTMAEVEKVKRYLHRSGKTVWGRLRMVPMPTLPGETPLHISLVEDITEGHLAEEALRISEQRFRTLIADLQVGVLIQSTHSTILLSNPRALKLLGLTQDQLLGRTSLDPDWNVIHEDGTPYPGQTHPVPQAIVTRKPVREAVMGVYRPTLRDRVWLSVGAEPQLADDGSVREVICTFVDISRRKAAEVEQEQIRERLFEVKRLKSLGVLVAGVAHTMNNVLAVIMGSASMRELGAIDPEDQDVYRTISKACGRGRDVVNSLIQFSQPTLPAPVPIELSGLVKEVCRFLSDATLNRARVVAIAPGESLWMLCDAGAINRALVELAFNAVEAMPDGGTLTLRASECDEGHVGVTVEDTGRGMAPAVLAQAMDPFFTTLGEHSGKGLGLSMVHGLVTAHNGTITVSSEIGLGTAVTLRFPRIPAPERTRTVSAPVPSIKLRRVLLVDDEEDVRFLMTRMLKKSGVDRVDTAAGGEAALACLSSGELPDVVILDQNMPGMTGVQLMARIRERNPDLPLLFSSGQPDIQNWPSLRQPKVSVIPKPFTLAEIQAKLAEFS